MIYLFQCNIISPEKILLEIFIFLYFLNFTFICIDAKLISEPQTCTSLWHTRGVEAIHTCWCCCHSNGLGCGCCHQTKKHQKEEWYTNDAFTLVYNHPLFIVSEQKNSPELIQHIYHTHLRQTKLLSFGIWLFISSFLLYTAYLALFTSAVLMGKHPQFFYDKAGVNLTVDLPTCQYVSNFLSNNPNVASEAFKTDTYKSIKFTLYVLLSIFLGKNLITILVLFPKVFRSGEPFYRDLRISSLLCLYS